MKKYKGYKLDIFLIIVLSLAIIFLMYFALTLKNMWQEEEIILGDKILSNEEALDIGNTLFNKVGKIYLNGGERDEIPNTYYRQNSNGSFSIDLSGYFSGLNNNIPYIKIKIDDIKNVLTDLKFQEFCQEFSILEYQKEYYREYENRYPVFNYADSNLKIISISNNKLLFNVESYYYLNYADALNKSLYLNCETEIRVSEFEVIYENGLWKVNKFTMPY